MPTDPFTFTITDPRGYDGDPYEVAERAVRQAEAMARLLTRAIDGAQVMARNAQLERELQATGECDAPGYAQSAEGRQFDALRESVQECERKLHILARAASYNPRQPLHA